MVSHDVCSVLWTVMASGWTFSSFSNTSDTFQYLFAVSTLSCSLQKPALLKHEALHFNTISSRSVTQKYMHTLILITLLYSCRRCRKCLFYNQREKNGMNNLKQPGAHFQRHTSKRASLSLFLDDTAQLPVILLRQCQAPYWVFSRSLSLCIYLYLIHNFKEPQKAPLNGYLPLFSNYVFSALSPVCTGICVD